VSQTVVTPRPATLLWRGLLRHCPLCGSGHLFRRWFLIRDHCPRCGFRFERLEGHWIGALAMNTIVAFGLMLGSIVVGIFLTYPDVPFLPVAVVAVTIALVVPLAFMPASRTLWTAIDLWMRPAEADEFEPNFER
jgi:uncharacterized protein (DUF983 family)